MHATVSVLCQRREGDPLRDVAVHEFEVEDLLSALPRAEWWMLHHGFGVAAKVEVDGEHVATLRREKR
jgi:hypothetical protein